MSERQQRVACPACGARFKADARAVPEGSEGLTARCRQCAHAFRVVRRGTDLDAESVDTSVDLERELEESESARLPPGAFRPGDRVGRYEVEAVLGRGGMGTVYKAFDPAANRHVAMKLLRSDTTDLDAMRFQREIEVQGNIQHPNIMPIFDSGTVGRHRYYTMELLKAPLDLLQIVAMARRGDLGGDPRLRPIARLEGLVEHVVLPLCQAVHHANTKEGVLHRDIKPANVMVDRATLRPWLIDFGVGTLLDKSNARLSHLARELPIPLKGDGIRVTGTLVFMPPEQARGEAHARGDVWGLGALLHYIVAGEPPVEPAVRPAVGRRDRIDGLRMLIDMARRDGREGEAREFERTLREVEQGAERTIEDLMRDVRQGRYRPRPPGLSRSLDAIIDRAMAPRTEDRYRHAMDLHADLRAWLAARPVKARVQGTGRAGSLWYQTRLFLRRHRIALGVGALGLGLGLFLALSGSDDGVDVDTVVRTRLAEAEAFERQADFAGARVALRQAMRVAPERDGLFVAWERVRLHEALLQHRDEARRLEQAVQRARASGAAAEAEAARIRLADHLDRHLDPARPPGSEAADGWAQEIQTLRAVVATTRRVEVRDLPAGAQVVYLPVEARSGRVAWTDGVEADASGGAALSLGWHVLSVRRQGRRLHLPFQLLRGTPAHELTCPVDPAAMPQGMTWVPGGRVRGPLGEASVGALWWDETEVSCARYAAFLESLPPDERRQRVPRTDAILDAPGRPLWARQGDGFSPPAGAASLPVTAISPEDARAFARFEGKRLPTSAEWAWAASGPDRRITALGDPRGAEAVARLAAPAAGLSASRMHKVDRSPFGLHDLAGNAAEITGTLDRWQGRTGWFVMGGSWLSGPGDAFVRHARVIPGWQPQGEVGFRCVKPLE